MTKKIIVTGAAGFIGSHTVDQLLAAGHSVFGVDNFRTGRWENLNEALKHPNFKFQELDVAEEKQFIEFSKGIEADAIIHLAALVSVPESITNPALNERLNFHATRVIAEAARQHKIPRIVFASSAAVYGDPKTYPIDEDAPKNPLSPYGSAKLASENLLFDYAKKHGIHVRCQRYFNVYGPRQDPHSPYSGVISIFLQHLVHNTSPTIFGDGEQTRDFICVLDVARANLIAAIKNGANNRAVNICTGEPVSINQLWHILCRNKKEKLSPNYASLRSGDIKNSYGLALNAYNTLNFKYSITLKDGIELIYKTN